jgi:radical SAM superfamily enzyme YgiQ (UPF0313 family)
MIALHVPMHTATRLAARLMPRLKELNPAARICFYGLYAAMNEEYLRRLGADAVFGGEFEEALLRFAQASTNAGGEAGPAVSLARQEFLIPARDGLPPLRKYVPLRASDQSRRVAGYTEASRGCKHLCRHCPVVPVYNGAFRVVQQDVVLADIRQQVAAGAEHITFGDPDFFNGPGHALGIVEQLHREHPTVSYDVTIKVEHLLKQERDIDTLRRTGCLFVTSAVESFDDAVLERLDKGHTLADFRRVARIFRETGLTLAPTFVPFHPWTTIERYREFLSLIRELDLVENVAPIQLAIRLLIPAGSRLLELEEIFGMVGPFDEERLSHEWANADPAVDELCAEVRREVNVGERRSMARREIFADVWELVFGESIDREALPARASIPYLEEPWYC